MLYICPAILSYLLSLISEFRLERCVVDYEAGLWQAIRHRFSNVKIQGCAFHWTQAVFRKVQELGLKKAYEERSKVHDFVSQVMSLHFLPKEHILGAFDSLRERATSKPILDLMNYIERTWMRNRLRKKKTAYMQSKELMKFFPISNWCVFNTAVRTNNDVEGWHHRLNTRVNVRGPVPFYLLFREAEAIPMQLKVVTEGKLKRHQRKRSRQVETRLPDVEALPAGETYSITATTEGRFPCSLKCSDDVNSLRGREQSLIVAIFMKCGLIYGEGNSYTG
ncbi:uncharacterized protein LOC110448202 [Mizuhopecten yessoensis]|uniref:uncharacterized protein LOC110448202 n=1 Tax=Mizuhopecten yessoensis TaxID=6573 RepID=UPI000B45C1F8|nr:uncharacterized protein LOC110448202 [Mizuhopecten yessoensis]